MRTGYVPPVRYSKLHTLEKPMTATEKEVFLARQKRCLIAPRPGREQISAPDHEFLAGPSNVDDDDRKTVKELAWCRICGAVRRVDESGTDILP